MIAGIIKSIVLRAGYEVYGLWRLPRLCEARKLQKIFRQFDIQFVLDVGANIGQFHDFLRKEVGFTGPIHSFEPIASLVDKMKQRQVEDPLWSIHQCALGSERGESEINIMNSTVFSSFLKPAYAAVPELAAMNKTARTERVKVDTLDAVVGSTLRTVDLTKTFLKLDTQGFDLQVMEGGRSALAKIPALQTEVSLRPIYDGMPNMWQSIAAFGELGFFISDFFVVTEDKHLRAIEFDCVMVREHGS